ncbi:MAG: LamG domain-containing protein [Bacteroidales bacterium]|nr:LamG domain-containing protein [Bacteroidales bacterium]
MLKLRTQLNTNRIMRYTISVLLIVLLTQAINSKAQNKALEFYYDQWAHIEGADPEGFTGLTLESWVKLDKYLDLAGTQFSGSFILAKEASVSNYYGFLLVVLSYHNADTGRLAFGLNFEHMGSNIHEGLHSYSKVPLNEWAHLAATWNGDSMSVFINGVFDRSLDVSQYGGFYDPPADSLNIGIRKVGPYLSATFGLIDEVRIWNVARTEQEIRETMYTELTGNENGLWAYYKLNTGTGQYIYDSGPNGFDGIRGSSPSTVTNDPPWRNSTVPLPYYTAQDGNWNNDATWAPGQKIPRTNWADIDIDHEVNVDSNLTARDIHINPSGSVTIDNGYTLTIDGDLTIHSDNSGSGSFIDNGTLIANREPRVERYLTQNYWHFIGMPVENDSVGVFYIPGGSDVYLKTHIESTNTWGPNITNVNLPLVQGRGYEVYVDDNISQDETIVFQGTLNSGDYTTGTGNFYDLEYTSGHGLNLISNPYPSALNGDINSWSKSDVSSKIWVWNSSSGNYSYWTGISGTNNDGWGTLTNGVIPAMQAFFVEATAPNPELTIPQSGRSHSNLGFYKNNMPANSVKIGVSGDPYYDAVFVGFDENASNGYDKDYDVMKLFGLDNAPQLYSVADEENLSINMMAALQNSEFVDLNFECAQDGWYELNFESSGVFDENIKIYLQDNFEESTTLFEPGDTYSFYHESQNNPERFNLKFLMPSGDPEIQENNFRIINTPGHLYVRFTERTDAKVFLYTASGSLVDEKQSMNGEEVAFASTELHGVYLLRIITAEQSYSGKTFIR